MKDLTNKKFGKLLVISFAEKKKKPSGQYSYYWFCKCDCGKTIKVSATHLKSGHTQSCGCHKNTMDGKSKDRLCQIWRAIKARCNNEKNNRYKYYGLKGIKVCNEWMSNYSEFENWAISNGYADNLTIDRIDNNGNYEPSNCRWIDNKKQQRNKSNNVFITYKNETHCIAEWAEIKGIKPATLHSRYKKKWEVEKILNKGTKNVKISI